jgi:hypothetical protein
MKAFYGRDDRHPHTVHFDEASEESMRQIHELLCNRWRLTDKPSISLLLQGVIRQFAASAQDDPLALKGLMDEIKARGGAIRRKRPRPTRKVVELAEAYNSIACLRSDMPMLLIPAATAGSGEDEEADV